MTDAHDPGHDHKPLRYTVWLRRWWGCTQVSVVATGSAKNDDELLLYAADGTVHSINYRRVERLTAVPVEAV